MSRLSKAAALALLAALASLPASPASAATVTTCQDALQGKVYTGCTLIYEDGNVFGPFNITPTAPGSTSVKFEFQLAYQSQTSAYGCTCDAKSIDRNGQLTISKNSGTCAHALGIGVAQVMDFKVTGKKLTGQYSESTGKVARLVGCALSE